MDFYKRARIVCLAIPYGKAATYGQIALLCGKPKNARQVGYALNRGRLGEGIPAHRVVNARGILSGAAAFETEDMQRSAFAYRNRVCYHIKSNCLLVMIVNILHHGLQFCLSVI